MRFGLVALGAALAVWAGAAAACAQPVALAPETRREIAITFDDAPRGDSEIMTGNERTQRLIAQLEAAGIEETAFYSIGLYTAQAGDRRLRAYAAAGHLIANHTYNHPRIAEMSAEDYLGDIARAHERLSGLPNYRPWFRFPYLAEGDSIEKRDAVRAGLREMGYAQGYVTIQHFDWSLDRIFNDATARGRNIDRDAVRDLYVETIANSVDYYDAIAVRYLGRSPRHALVLHENDLAALFLVDLAAELRARGWTIITATEGFNDPIAEQEPQTMFLGQGRVAALAMEAGAPWQELIGPRETEEELAALFFARAVRGAAPAKR